MASQRLSTQAGEANEKRSDLLVLGATAARGALAGAAWLTCEIAVERGPRRNARAQRGCGDGRVIGVYSETGCWRLALGGDVARYRMERWLWAEEVGVGC